ncbi:MAG: hypothetical protein ACKOCK_13485 [Chloroflexota bacterium]
MLRSAMWRAVLATMMLTVMLGAMPLRAMAQDATPSAEECDLLCQAKSKAAEIDLPSWPSMPESVQGVIETLLVQARQAGADGQELIDEAVVAATYCAAAIQAEGPNTFGEAANQIVEAQAEFEAPRTVIAGLQATPLGGVPVVAEAMSITAFLLALLTNDQFISVLEGTAIPGGEIPSEVQEACVPGTP